MAKTISEEEIQLRKRARRRLIGAIALVTMTAVFLPMVLDHEPKPAQQDISIQIPSPTTSGTFTSKIVPVAPSAPNPPPAIPPPQVAAAPASAAESNPPPHDTEASPVKPAPQPKPAIEAKPAAKSQPTANPVAKTPGKAVAGAFVVQVAALNDAEKAKDMQGRISGAGLKAYTEIVPTTKGNVTRVRAGPYATRGEAEKVRDKLKELGLSGNVVPK